MGKVGYYTFWDQPSRGWRSKIDADLSKLNPVTENPMPVKYVRENEDGEEIVVKRDFRPSKLTCKKIAYAFDSEQGKFVVGDVIEMVFHSECCSYKIRTTNGPTKGQKFREFWTYRLLKKEPQIKK